MNPERQLDPPESIELEYPDPIELALLLPNKLFNDLLLDEVGESAGNGKMHLEHIFDLHVHFGSRPVSKAMDDVISNIGNHPLARDWYWESRQ